MGYGRECSRGNRGWGVADDGTRGWGDAGGAREDDREAGARRPAIEEDEAAVRVDRALHDGEAKPAPPDLGGEERIEQAVANLVRDAGTDVRHAQRDAAV